MLSNFYPDMAGLLLSIRVSDTRPYGEIVSDSDGENHNLPRRNNPPVRAGYINSGVYLFNQTIAEAFPTEQDSFSIERGRFPKGP